MCEWQRSLLEADLENVWEFTSAYDAGEMVPRFRSRGRSF